jgi:hypothetical protein
MSNPKETILKFIDTLENLNEVLDESGGTQITIPELNTISALDLLITLGCNGIGFSTNAKSKPKKKIIGVNKKSCPYGYKIGLDFKNRPGCESCDEHYEDEYVYCKFMNER